MPQSRVSINEEEMKEAVAEYLAKHYGQSFTAKQVSFVYEYDRHEESSNLVGAEVITNLERKD